MATSITSSGPTYGKALKDLVNLTLEIKQNGSSPEIVQKMDELIEAVKEITRR